MRPNSSHKKIIFAIALFLLNVFSVYHLLAENTEKPTIKDIFLTKKGIWKGDFTNYVNQKGGITQSGIIMVEINFENGLVKMRNKFFNKDEKQSDYSGYSLMKIKGDKLEYGEDVSIDENTGNKIINHKFVGYILDRQIYIFEYYEEVLPDGNRDRRRNSLHYVLLGEKKILQVADVYLNDELLVFAHTILSRME